MERITHSLIRIDERKTGEAANLTLRVVRSSDGYMLDWDDWTFKSSGWGTLNKAATEFDATNNPGGYYWDVGGGSTIDHIFPESFTDDEYLFEIDYAALPYHVSWACWIRRRRPPAVFAAQYASNKKQLSEGASGNYKVYEDDGVTVMITKSVKDKGGASIKLDSGVPAQEEPA